MTDNASVIIDSLSANEFEVSVNGEKVSGVFRVAGLVAFDVGEKGGEVLITKMVQRDGNNPFNRWIRESVTAAGNGGDAPQRSVEIIAVDDGTETRRWTLEGATITGVAYSDFDSTLTELVEERIGVRYTGLSMQWSATSNLG